MTNVVTIFDVFLDLFVGLVAFQRYYFSGGTSSPVITTASQLATQVLTFD